MIDDGVWAASCDAMAAGSILLARRAAALPAERERDELGTGVSRDEE